MNAKKVKNVISVCHGHLGADGVIAERVKENIVEGGLGKSKFGFEIKENCFGI